MLSNQSVPDGPALAGSGGSTSAAELRNLFNQRYGQFVALAQVFLGSRSEAEDVVQDAFAAALRRTGRLRDDPAGYVAQSVANGARSRLRRRAVERRTYPPVQSLYLQDSDTELFDLVRRLPDRQAQVIVCRYVLDLTFEQTAASLGISRRAARTHAERAMSQLKKWIEEASR